MSEDIKIKTDEEIIFLGAKKVQIYLSPEEEDKARKKINEAWLGQEACNVWDKEKGEFVSIPGLSPHVELKLQQVHHALSRGVEALVQIGIDPMTGEFYLGIGGDPNEARRIGD